MSSEKKLIHTNSNTTTELKPSIKTSDYKVQCSIVKHGLTKAYANYYLCECDPERKNPICENCFKECHKGSGHAEIKMIQQEKICMCGIKSHQPFNENENLDNKYSKKCLFGEWANECKYKICFKDKDNNIFICLLCKNICRCKRHRIPSVHGTRSPCARLQCDANGDGCIDLRDAVLISRYLAGGWGVELI